MFRQCGGSLVHTGHLVNSLLGHYELVLGIIGRVFSVRFLGMRDIVIKILGMLMHGLLHYLLNLRQSMLLLLDLNPVRLISPELPPQLAPLG